MRGELHAGGRQVPVEVDATLRQVGDELQIEATTFVDQRELGMTRSPLGILRAPSKLLVSRRLVRAEGQR